MHCTAGSRAECRANLSGKVIDETGKSIASALVSLSEERDTDLHKATRFFPTDVSGHFSADVDVPNAAKYWVLAKKEESGYPDTRLAFYDNREPPKVLLGCKSSVSGLVVMIGPKAAYIARISVLDGESGTAVPNASITLRRLDTPIPGFPLQRF